MHAIFVSLLFPKIFCWLYMMFRFIMTRNPSHNSLGHKAIIDFVFRQIGYEGTEYSHVAFLNVVPTLQFRKGRLLL